MSLVLRRDAGFIDGRILTTTLFNRDKGVFLSSLWLIITALVVIFLTINKRETVMSKHHNGSSNTAVLNAISIKIGMRARLAKH
ncbi:MAG: hypothetical protein P8Q15_01665 [Methylophilaceae bacterium]|nr:hypothetical protein [Methylophilaceae bacterium]